MSWPAVGGMAIGRYACPPSQRTGMRTKYFKRLYGTAGCREYDKFVSFDVSTKKIKGNPIVHQNHERHEKKPVGWDEIPASGSRARIHARIWQESWDCIPAYFLPTNAYRKIRC